jgi:aryl-alcohol dehydrogenase-like predicted oxidoreductase
VRLGRTGLLVGRLGVGASYGVPARAIQRAFHEFGVNYFYWGSMRRDGMKAAIRALSPGRRDRFVVALQSYDRTGPLMRVFVERGLKALGLEAADVLILGWRQSYPSKRVIEAAVKLRDEGKVRFLAMSSHHRPLLGDMARRAGDLPIDIYMFRYNAAHRGAERDIFPYLADEGRPGVTCYTATRWGQLLQKRRMPPGERPMTASECYRFVLTNPKADLCIAGPADEEQMDEALRALDGGPLSEEEMARVRRIGDFVHG